MFMNFYFINSKLVYSFKSLSLKPEQGSRVVHFTMLAPTYPMILNTILSIAISNREDCHSSLGIKVEMQIL